MDFETGRLWASLADYYIRRGLFDKACDVFEEGITSVNTVHDFSLIFDAYAHFEESTLNAKLVIAREDGDRADAKSNEDHGADFLKGDTGDDVDLRLARLEKLVGRRPELISGRIRMILVNGKNEFRFLKGIPSVKFLLSPRQYGQLIHYKQWANTTCYGLNSGNFMRGTMTL